MAWADMTLERAIFYFFAAILIGAATGVITARNSVHAALFLVLSFFSSAALWLLLEAEFLAIILVLVYVGAVMVLFLFVVMMLDIKSTRAGRAGVRHLPLGAAIAALIALQMAIVVGSRRFGADLFPAPERRPPDYSNTRELGELLYTVYVYPFEIAGAILLLAIVAAICLTLRPRVSARRRPRRWTTVRRAERIRLVEMPSEPSAARRQGADETGG
jgi:NADH-quinone oxidoreductase subunit J